MRSVAELPSSRKRSFRLRAEVDAMLDEVQRRFLLRSRTEAAEACIEIAHAALDGRRAEPAVESNGSSAIAIDLAPLVREINRIGVNINQTVRRLHTDQVTGPEALQSQMKDLDELLEILKAALAEVSS